MTLKFPYTCTEGGHFKSYFKFCDKYETEETERRQQLRYCQRPWLVYWCSSVFPFSLNYRTEIAQTTGKSLMSKIYTEIWNTTISVRIISNSSNICEMTGDPRRNQLDSTRWYKNSLRLLFIYTGFEALFFVIGDYTLLA